MKLFKKLTALLVVMFAFVTVLAVANVVEAADVTITFDDTAKRTTFSTSQQIWEENGITITNNKSKSTSPVADYVSPARFYKSSELIVVYTGKFTSVTFDCNNTTYATAMKNSITVGTATVSSDKVTVTFAEAVSSYTVASLTGGQVRMDAISVTPYVEGEAPTPTIGISGTAYAMVGDDTVTLESSVTNLEDYTVTWDSSNENVATVSNGVVTVLGEGKTTITAVIDGTEVETSTEFVVYPSNANEITIAKAIEICNLVGNSQTPYLYSATGVVESISTYEVVITDGANKITAFSLVGKEDLEIGNAITITGKLKNYNNNKPEFDSNCTYVLAEVSDEVQDVKDALNNVNSYMSLAYAYKYSTTETVTEGKTVTAKYPEGATTNMTGGNDAALVGLDESLFTVVSEKGEQNNHIGLNKSGQMRLYYHSSGDGSALKISTKNSQNIVSISIEFGSTVGLFSVNGVEGTKETTDYDINSTEVIIKNIQTTNVQVHINSITINLEGGTTTVTEYSDSNFRFKCGIDSSISEEFASLENVTYGIKVTSNGVNKYFEYTSDLLLLDSERGIKFVIIDLEDVLSNSERIDDEFTVRAYAEYDGITYVSENAKTYSVYSIVQEYINQSVEEAVDLKNRLEEFGYAFTVVEE